MTGILYHISPITGVPSVCHAKPGNCPYGGNTGMEHHYATYEEAQAYADEILEKKYPLFNQADAQLKANNFNLGDCKYGYLDNYSDEKALNIINNTQDSDLLQSVVNGAVLVKSDDDRRFILAAARNPNMPYTKSVLQNPDSYTEDFLNSVLSQKNLTEDDLFTVAEHSEFRGTQERALTSDKISTETIKMNLTKEKIDRGTYPLLFLALNPNCPKELRIEGQLRLAELRR